MKVTTVRASYKRSFDIGKGYLSLGSECEALLDEGEDEIEALKALHTQCREMVRLQYEKALNNVKEDLTSINQPIAPF